MSAIDWSATAAWIALIISVVGTVVGPIVTALINNCHQRKMFVLQQSAAKASERERIIRAAVSNTGAVLSSGTIEAQTDFGRAYYAAYPFVSSEHWPTLDSFYFDVAHGKYESAFEKLPTVESLFLSAIQIESK